MGQRLVVLALRAGLQHQKRKIKEKGTGQRPWNQRGRGFMNRVEQHLCLDGEEQELITLPWLGENISYSSWLLLL